MEQLYMYNVCVHEMDTGPDTARQRSHEFEAA